MTVAHLRSEWTDAPRGGVALVPAEVLGVAVHWNGPPVHAAPADQLRADRRYHVDTRGWDDIAYNLAADQTGGLWEARGIQRRSAANGTTELNRRWVAIVALIGEGQTPTDDLLDAIAAGVAMVRFAYPRARAITWHGAIRPDPTACPGPDLIAAARSGRLDPDTHHQEDPVTPADIEAVADAVLARLDARAAKVNGITDLTAWLAAIRHDTAELVNRQPPASAGGTLHGQATVTVALQP